MRMNLWPHARAERDGEKAGIFRRAIAMLALLLGGTVASAQAAIPAAERTALINLFVSTQQAGWTLSTNWCDGICPVPVQGVQYTFNVAGTECTWYGITCDAAQTHVISIDLHSNALGGPLTSLSDLTELESFDVHDNGLYQDIPPQALTGLTHLKYFYAYKNQLESIPSLAGLTSLQDFIVYSNNLSGSIPSLAGLTNLQLFWVHDNQLTGSIPGPDWPEWSATLLRIFEQTERRHSVAGRAVEPGEFPGAVESARRQHRGAVDGTAKPEGLHRE